MMWIAENWTTLGICWLLLVLLVVALFAGLQPVSQREQEQDSFERLNRTHIQAIGGPFDGHWIRRKEHDTAIAWANPIYLPDAEDANVEHFYVAINSTTLGRDVLKFKRTVFVHRIGVEMDKEAKNQ